MKTVLIPIKVPNGKHCWEYHNGEICEHFDNYGGHENCSLGFHLNKRDKNGCLKSIECKKLKEKNV